MNTFTWQMRRLFWYIGSWEVKHMHGPGCVGATKQPGQSSNCLQKAVRKWTKDKIPISNATIRDLQLGSGRAMSIFVKVNPASTGNLMLFSFCGMLACSVWQLSALWLKAKGKRSNNLYKLDESQESYPASDRQGSKCWDYVQSPAGEEFGAGELRKCSLICGNENLPLGLGGMGGKATRAQQPTVWKK